MSNQEFVVNDRGILGRRYTDESKTSFEGKQLRIINNVLIFTDDYWQTAKAALGEVAYLDPEAGAMRRAYGVLAQAIVGSLIIGEKMYITNDKSATSITEGGILIKNAVGDETFKVTPSGDVVLSGTVYAKAGVFSGRIEAQSGYIGSQDNGFEISNKSISNGKTYINNDQIQGVYIGTDGFAIGRPPVEGQSYGTFKVTRDGVVYATNLEATDTITAGGVQSGIFNIMDGNRTLGALQTATDTAFSQLEPNMLVIRGSNTEDTKIRITPSITSPTGVELTEAGGFLSNTWSTEFTHTAQAFLPRPGLDGDTLEANGLGGEGISSLGTSARKWYDAYIKNMYSGNVYVDKLYLKDGGVYKEIYIDNGNLRIS